MLIDSEMSLDEQYSTDNIQKAGHFDWNVIANCLQDLVSS